MDKIKRGLILVVGISVMSLLPGFFIVGALRSQDYWGVTMGLGVLIIWIVIIVGCVKSLNK